MSFAETFKGTLEYAHKPFDENHEGPKTRRPVTFAPIDRPFRGLKEPSGSQTVTLKSIRAPKFSVQYEVPLSDSVYSLKERLLTDPSGPLSESEIKYTASSVKLLIKSKVISDTRQLAELPDASFIVMFVSGNNEELDVPLPAQIYWGDEANLINSTSASKEVTTDSSDAGKQERKLPGINDQFWHEIELVARKYVEDPKSLVQEMRSKLSVPEELDLD